MSECDASASDDFVENEHQAAVQERIESERRDDRDSRNRQREDGCGRLFQTTQSALGIIELFDEGCVRSAGGRAKERERRGWVWGRRERACDARRDDHSDASECRKLFSAVGWKIGAEGE
ncbi:hypothetical protein BLNAU_17629 [Blattamonas nauphoetae]|uniref:Uncharacterized protein n=1 Tax=Blattamonas nauphoetae TaxID=2049346 RepID=A0ABQ9X983_9EUKA|nr:hypothetical protein BLNAU_17629 [Blattamonas nauphoetae]